MNHPQTAYREILLSGRMITKEDSKESHRECWNIYRRIAIKSHIRKTKSHTIKILKEMNMDGV